MINNILESNEIQMIKLDGKELSVVENFEFLELTQSSGSLSWERTGKKSRAILLANDIWLMRIPSKEFGKYVWLKMICKDDSSSLTNFYRGTDDSIGPARKFAKNGQSNPVPYILYDKNWSVVDIGAFGVICLDKSEIMKSGDRVYFVTSKSDNEYLFYIDARQKEAKGSGGVFIGKEFNTSDIEESL